MLSTAGGRLEVSAIGGDGTLGHMWQTAPSSGPWGGWEPIGPHVDPGSLAMFRNADGRLEVFADADGGFGHMWQIEPDRSDAWSD
jgi:hypothetical protein